MVNQTKDMSALERRMEELLDKEFSLDQLDELEHSTALPKFSDEIAFDLGTFIRSQARKLFPNKCITIDITLPNRHCLFRCTSINGSSLDNDNWVERKQNTVFKFNHSTYFIRMKKGSIPLEERFFISSKEYAFHGGAVPIYLENVTFPIGCLTISGLKQDEDHFLATSALLEFKKSIQ